MVVERTPIGEEPAHSSVTPMPQVPGSFWSISDARYAEYAVGFELADAPAPSKPKTYRTTTFNAHAIATMSKGELVEAVINAALSIKTAVKRRSDTEKSAKEAVVCRTREQELPVENAAGHPSGTRMTKSQLVAFIKSRSLPANIQMSRPVLVERALEALKENPGVIEERDDDLVGSDEDFCL